MALRIKDRVKQGTTTTGAGTINLDVSFSSSGFQDFSVLGNGTETYYAIEEGSNFEIGLGTYNSNTLSRSTILDSSNGGAKIALAGNANVFVTYPADKAVFTDADNNATVTGLILGQTGVKFNDGTIQTTAFDGSTGGYDFTVSDGSNSEVISSGNTVVWTGAGNTTVSYDAGTNTFSVSGTDQDLSSYATQTYVNDASGHLQSQISTNDTDISNLSGLVSTNTTNISSNDTDIANLSGLVSTNSTDIATVSGLTVTNANNISSNDTDISNLSGLVATNTSDISTVSGLLYNSWTVTDGSNSEAISAGDQVKFTGEGNTTVIYDTGTNTVSISGAAGGAGGGYDFTVSDGSSSEVVASGDSVTWTGTGATTVSYNNGNNTFTINTPSSETSYDYWTATDGTNTSNIANGNTVKITGSNDTTVSFASGDPNLFTVQSTQEVLLTGINAGQPTGFSMLKSVPLSVSGGDAISVSLTSVNPATFLVSHDNTSSQSTLSTTPNFFITSITLDDYGHVTSLGSGEVTGVGSGSGGGGDFSFNVCSDTISNGDTLTIQGGSGIQVTCGSTTTISSTGVLMSGDASLYEYWTLQGDGTDCNSSTFPIQNATTVQVQGSGGTTVCMAGGSDPVITISSEANLYDGWIAKGFNISGDAIQKTIEDDDSVTITGAGSTTVIAETGAASITYTISGDNSSFYGNWKAGDGDGTFATIQSTNEVEWSGAGLTSVDRTDKLFTISGSPTIYLGGSGITVTGNSSPYTIHGDLATTTSVGITQLDHDISGASQTGAATPYGVKEYVNDYIGSSGYGYWVASDGSTSSNIDKNETLEFVGQGIITATVTSGDPTTTVSISGAQYIPGSGLTQDPLKTFNVNTDNSTLEVVSDTVRVKDSGITNIKLAGGITNDKLVNNSFTVTAASGLTGGGEAELGSGVTLGIGNGAITTGMLESSSITINVDNGITGGGEIFLGGTGVLSGVDGTTSVKGVVQLQDSAEDGVVDKAITPNAVYDVSGALQTNIDGKDNYTKWILKGDAATTTDVETYETVQFTGVGATTVSLSGTDNRIVAISSTDTNSTYTAGAGLTLLSNEFSLTNDSFVLNAGSGLLITDSATIALGDTRTLNVYTDESTIEVHSDRLRVKDEGITAAKLNSDVNLDAVTDHGATTTNNITVGMIDTSGVRTPISSGAGGATATFDLSTASTFTHTLAANSTTTLAEVNATDGQKFMIRLEQNSAGTGLVNFFSTIRWAGGTAPTLTATTGKIDTFGFLTTTSGNYEGFIIGQNI